MATLNYAFKELSCKIVFYGCGLCGKTTNLIHIHKTVPQKFRGELVSLATEQDRTLFFDFLPLDLGEVKGFKTKFQLYTVPGQVYYNATRKLVLRGVDGLVFVVDSQRDRFQENIDSLENLRQNLAEYGYRLSTGPADFEGIPWVIQYNKRDMPQVSAIPDLEKVLNEHRAPYLEAVAVTGQGVKDTLKAISSLVIKKLNADSGPSTPAPSAKPEKVSVPVGGGKSDSEYEAMTNEEMESDEVQPAKAAPAKPAAAPKPAPASAPAAPAAASAKVPEPRAKVAPAPEPPVAAVAAPASPMISFTQYGKALWRGLGTGSATLTFSTITGEPGLYQLTGRVTFLGIFGASWSRKLRLSGPVEKSQGSTTGKYLQFASDDGQTPPLSVFVKDDQQKQLFVEYMGKMGQVQIVPPGTKPLS